MGDLLRITQQELAYLVGLVSRQRVNEALATLQAEGLVRTEYGGLRVLDLPRLAGYRICQAKKGSSARPACAEQLS